MFDLLGRAQKQLLKRHNKPLAASARWARGALSAWPLVAFGFPEFNSLETSA